VIAMHEVKLVVPPVGEPAIEQIIGQPGTPAPLQGHARIGLAHHQANAGRQQRKIDQRQGEHPARVAPLKSVEDFPVPNVHSVGGDEIGENERQDRRRE